MRYDTSIDCDAEKYKSFLALDILLIAVYQSIPLVWFVLLWRHRKHLNPEPTDPLLPATDDANGEEHDKAEGDPPRTKLAPKSKSRGRVSVQSQRVERSLMLRSLAEVGHSGAGAEARRHDDPVVKHLGFLWQVKTRKSKGIKEWVCPCFKCGLDLTCIRELDSLQQDYRPSAWHFEVVDMYRRVLFTAAIPVLTPDKPLRAAMACALAVASLAVRDPRIN